jgi:putative oxidoreductase
MHATPQLMLVGRLLLALLFIVAGINKIAGYAGTVGYFTKLGMPMPEAMVWLSVLVELGGGALLIAGWQTRRVAWLLVAFTVVATFMGHRFWQADPAQYMNQLNHFLKNVAIIGGLLYVAAQGAGALSVDARRRI